MSERTDAKAESLSIPPNVRAAVDTRDGMHCRICGRYLGERRALHHIIYGGGSGPGMGGRRKHLVDEIVTVCWMPGDGGCHDLAHSDKALWQPLLLEVVQRKGTTALQLKRWADRKAEQAFQKTLYTALSPHDYEPSAEGSPMHTDPLCTVCNGPKKDWVHQ